MNSVSQYYGSLTRIKKGAGSEPEYLPRIPLGMRAEQGGLSESELRDLLFQSPSCLPIAEIDPSYSNPIPVCKELSTQAGFVDAVYINSMGRLILCEFKLWRNPQARREAIGQIIDYAKELASWDYQDLQREVSRSLDQSGNVLFKLVQDASNELDESRFVDCVSLALRRGEFLMLIVGDGIHEGTESIVDYVQNYSGLHFNLALVEATLYRDSDSLILVQPRCLAKTEIVQRVVIEEGLSVEPIKERESPPTDYEIQNSRFWEAVLDDFSFSDPEVDKPESTKEATLYIKVRNSGWGNFGLNFAGYIKRDKQYIGCYLTYRQGEQRAERVFNEFDDDFESLRHELGEDLVRWKNNYGRPRIGFKTQDCFPFQLGVDSDQTFECGVEWMQKKLDNLVSSIYPQLQSKLNSGR